MQCDGIHLTPNLGKDVATAHLWRIVRLSLQRLHPRIRGGHLDHSTELVRELIFGNDSLVGSAGDIAAPVGIIRLPYDLKLAVRKQLKQ